MEFEIKAEELEEKLKEGLQLIDMRSSESIAYGKIPQAECLTEEQIYEKAKELSALPGVIIYCTRGQESLRAALRLSEMGVKAFSLAGGYNAWLIQTMDKMDTSKLQKEVERGIQKTWHKRLFSPFAKACKTYDLIQDGDRIAVCISGGKDSMLMAKLFQEIQRHRQKEFELVFLVMDPGYSEVNRRIIEQNARNLGIPITIFESDIFESVFTIENSPCYLCARMRRGHLYSKAKELGCNKIALGHHYDDVIETILMGMLYGAQIQTMMPKLHSTNFEGMELIRPLYLVREEDIKAWRDAFGLHFLQCACKFTDTCSSCQEDGQSKSKRLETKKLIAELKKTNPVVESNIFNSMENVMLDTVLCYKKDGVRHHFLEDY
ncbi:MAG: ATP-binding protein [Eubacteriales bacterium]|nr:ATP-binding protein [Eubacteriales bacterium]